MFQTKPRIWQLIIQLCIIRDKRRACSKLFYNVPPAPVAPLHNCSQYVEGASRGFSITQKLKLLPTLLCRPAFLPPIGKSLGAATYLQPMHHSPAKEEGEEDAVKRKLLLDRSSSVICKKHRSPDQQLVRQPKPTAFSQETGTAECSWRLKRLWQLFLATFNRIADSFDESQGNNCLSGKIKGKVELAAGRGQ